MAMMKAPMEQTLQRAAQKSKPKQKTEETSKDFGERSFGKASIRAMEGEGNERKFELSFSSEEPYQRWFGLEILSHADGAADLSRLNEIGVLLFNHDTDCVLGRVDRAWIDDKRGKAEVTFDDDETAEVIYQKVKSGTLKGVSVRYSVDSWEEVMPGKASADGFTGPCDIARKWTPLEISVVSVPADATVGVGRSRNSESESNPKCLGAFEAQVKANKNYL
jgi:HK97 family phage prohead protease